MNYPPPPPPPPVHSPELVAHQSATLAWADSHGYGTATIKPVAAPPPPAPKPVVIPTAPVAKPRINVRAKGQRGEREVVGLLQAVVDKVYRDRGLVPIVIQRNQLQSHLGGEDLAGLDGFAVEVKFQENENVSAWWRQAVEQAARKETSNTQLTELGVVPVLFYRASRQAWKVRMRAYLNTPGDRDMVQMDVDTNLEDFVEWFGNAYAERVDRLLGV